MPRLRGAVLFLVLACVERAPARSTNNIPAAPNYAWTRLQDDDKAGVENIMYEYMRRSPHAVTDPAGPAWAQLDSGSLMSGQATGAVPLPSPVALAPSRVFKMDAQKFYWKDKYLALAASRTAAYDTYKLYRTEVYFYVAAQRAATTNHSWAHGGGLSMHWMIPRSR